MKAIRQMIRGCGTLPHVGEHPGTATALMMLAVGALAGLDRGWQATLMGVAVMAILVVPVYLYGAYDRANLSDELELNTISN